MWRLRDLSSMILVAHAILNGIVSAEDGEHVLESARAALSEWLGTKEIRTGDHILIVRDIEAP